VFGRGRHPKKWPIGTKRVSKDIMPSNHIMFDIKLKKGNWESFHVEWFSFSPVTLGPCGEGQNMKNANSDPFSRATMEN
jgi:hypothetical protein